jgi:hypothetical protein
MAIVVPLLVRCHAIRERHDETMQSLNGVPVGLLLRACRRALGVDAALLREHGAVSEPVAQAMAAGVPVITSNVSCLPEVAGDAAVCRSPDDALTLADAARSEVLVEHLLGLVREIRLKLAAVGFMAAVVAQDDDSGGDLNARIVYAPPQDGEFRVIATTLNKALGGFTLTVRQAE